MRPQPKTYFTAEEYLVFERDADYKSEYWHGEMFAMAGATIRHTTIVANTMFLLVGQLKDRTCQAHSNDLRIKIPETGLYTYPAIVIICGKPVFDDDQQDTVLNPQVIIEILSPSTEAYDRGAKFEHYRTLESLSDYLLISQVKPKIEHFVRQPENLWVLSESQSLEDVIEIVSIACQLRLVDVYDKVEFPRQDEKPLLKVV